MDAGLELFDKSEEKKIRTEQARVAEDAEEHEAFRCRYRARRQEVRVAAEAAPRPKGKGKARRGNEAGQNRFPAKVPEGALTQPEVKSLLPPGAYVWRALQRGGWAVQLKPYKSYSQSWRMWGHRGAAMRVLQHVWKLHMDDHGLDSCPIAGLMEEQFVVLEAE
eukprot:11298318-Heterocapsa_arctica.AAC.1